MHEIKCPKCQQMFTVDEAGYADIARQVRDAEFAKTLDERLELAAREKAGELAVLAAQNAQQIAQLKAENAAKVQQLESKLEQTQQREEAAVAQERAAFKQERETLQLRLEQATRETESALELQKTQFAAEALTRQAQADKRIQELQHELAQVQSQQELRLTQAVNEVAQERDRLVNELEQAKLQRELSEKAITERFQLQLQDRDDAITRLRDLKARMSTKMVGETLEQHCEIEFNKMRAAAFSNAYFEKDNDASAGSKGDFVFRDFDDVGNEIVSIMFEMKNESDATARKNKNEHFFKELDKDRREKNCEYAVLVSLLESDSDLYNSGIVDVSHRHEKMYVVRPQFFIPIITLLRNAGMKALGYRAELEQVRQQNIDITKFSESLEEFREKFGKNFELAGKHYQEAIKQIDVSINALQKVKDKLVASERQLRLANDKAQELSIRKLTRDNPTMRQKFAEIEGSGV